MRHEDRQLFELGRLAVAAAKVESFARVLLNELMDEDPQVGRDMFGDLLFSGVNERIVPLAAHRQLDDFTRTKIRDATEDAASAMKLRNIVLHSHWTAEGVQVGGKGRRAPRPRRVTLENVRAVATAAENAADHLQLAWGLVCASLGRAEDARPDRWAIATPPEESELPTRVERYFRSFKVVPQMDLGISGLSATVSLSADELSPPGRDAEDEQPVD